MDGLKKALSKPEAIHHKCLRLLEKTFFLSTECQADSFDLGGAKFRTANISFNFILNFTGRLAAGISAADQRSGACSHNQVDINALFLQNIKNTDMRKSSDTAATQGQAKPFFQSIFII